MPRSTASAGAYSSSGSSSSSSSSNKENAPRRSPRARSVSSGMPSLSVSSASSSRSRRKQQPPPPPRRKNESDDIYEERVKSARQENVNRELDSIAEKEPKTQTYSEKGLMRNWNYAETLKEQDAQIANDEMDLRFVAVPHPIEQQARNNLGPCGDGPCFGCKVALGNGDTMQKEAYQKLVDIWYENRNFGNSEEGARQVSKYFEERIRSVHNNRMMAVRDATEDELRAQGVWLEEWSPAMVKFHMEKEIKNTVAKHNVRLDQVGYLLDELYDNCVYVRDGKDPENKRIIVRRSVIKDIAMLHKIEMELWRLDPTTTHGGKVYAAVPSENRGVLAMKSVALAIRPGLSHRDLG